MRKLVLLVALLATPALAFDPSNMTPAEKEAFGTAVREYLLENPYVIYEALAAIENQRMNEAAANDKAMLSEAAPELFHAEGDPVLGNPEGDVTLVVFTDYRCPYCAEMEPEIIALAEADPMLRIVIKEYPILTPESREAAAFALAVAEVASPEMYALVHSELFVLRGGYSDAALHRYAESMGLPADLVMELKDAPETQARIDANLALGGRFGLDQTPSFVLPHLMVRGAIPADTIAGYIREARAR